MRQIPGLVKDMIVDGMLADFLGVCKNILIGHMQLYEFVHNFNKEKIVIINSKLD